MKFTLYTLVFVLFAGMSIGEELMQMESCCPVLELRQYNLIPGKRDQLIELFDKHFIESQEETGMKIVGQFRNLHQPDRFVWIRGFHDMDSREKALSKFYFESQAWKDHKAAANSTMIDVNNVLLLKPARAASGFKIENLQRPEFDDTTHSGRLNLATIYYFDKDFATEKFTIDFEKRLIPEIGKSGAAVLSYLVSENSENTFPRLPVREDANVLVWWSSFENRDKFEAYRRSAENIRIGEKSVSQFLKEQGVRSVELLELTPTSRSLLR